MGGTYRGPKSDVLTLGVRLMVVQLAQLGGRIWGEVEPKREALANEQSEA